MGQRLLVGMLVVVAFWATYPQEEGILRICQSLLACVALVGLLINAYAPRVGIALAAASTMAAYVLGLTQDPFLLASAALLSFAEGRGMHVHPRIILSVLVAFVIALLVCSDEGAEDQARWMILSVISLTGAWTLGVQIRQHREEAMARAKAEEKVRLTREVHDILSYSLGTIGVRAGVSARVDTNDASSLRACLCEIEGISRSGVQQLRDLLDQERRTTDVAPEAREGASERWSLVQEMHGVVHACEGANIRTDVNIDDSVDTLPDTVRTTILRVVKELAANTIVHAHARNIHIRVTAGSEKVHIRVSDDGKGGADTLLPGHRLAILRERIGLLDGELCFSDSAGGGLSVDAVIPCRAGGV